MATWKVYDHHQNSRSGIVCFITVAGFLSGPGFQKMRDYLRRTCDDIWVIDCSPEGLQPEVNTRVFQDVQQPVCIVLASRSASKDPTVPATVRFRALPCAHRLEKFKALSLVSLKDPNWIACPSEWREPFLPASKGAWATFPLLDDFFVYNGSGLCLVGRGLLRQIPSRCKDAGKLLLPHPLNSRKLFSTRIYVTAMLATNTRRRSARHHCRLGAEASICS